MINTCPMCGNIVKGKSRTFCNSICAQYAKTIRRYHKLTPDAFKALQKQYPVCAICQYPGPKLCVDHDHRTGEIRGRICNGCNSGLGFFEDNIGYLQAAIAYLTTFQGDTAKVV